MAEEQTALGKRHYAWVIFAGCCCLGASGMALVGGLKGIYIVAGSAWMGLTPAQWSLSGVSLAIVDVILFPVFGQLIEKHLKLLMIIGIACQVTSVLLYTVVHSVPGILLIGALSGVGLPMTCLLTIPTLMTNWFAPKYRGRYLSIAFACGGAAAFIWAPLFTWFLVNLGYVTCYIINACFLAAFTVPWIFFFKFSPEEMGLKPYGYDPNADVATKAQTGRAYGMTAAHAFKTAAFWIMFLGIACLSIGAGFNGILRAMAGEVLANTPDAANAAFIGAWMISTASIGNMLAKLAFGFLNDKKGVKPAMIIFVSLTIIAFALFALFPGNIVMMFVASFLLGSVGSLSSVGNPIVIRTLFGGMEYQKIYGRLSIASSIVGGFSLTIVTAIAAAAGSYVKTMYFGIGLTAIFFIMILIVMSFFGKLKWDKTPESEAAEQAAAVPAEK